MAIGWMTILKTVPWVDVIRSAPVIADGARKLWNNVGKKTPEPPPPRDVYVHDQDSGDPQARLQARLADMEDTARALHRQVLASTELIKDLADQNTVLIRRVEAHRVRLLWLSVVVAVLALAVLWQFLAP